MAFVKISFIVATFAVTGVIVIARPHDEPTTLIPPMSLSLVANKTMCPISISYDKNEDRIPRVIKHLKCAETPNQLCSKTTHGCCKHRHTVGDINFTTNCVEIEDTVLVTYKHSPVPQTMQVSVGCNCMMQESFKAQKVG